MAPSRASTKIPGYTPAPTNVERDAAAVRRPHRSVAHKEPLRGVGGEMSDGDFIMQAADFRRYVVERIRAVSSDRVVALGLGRFSPRTDARQDLRVLIAIRLVVATDGVRYVRAIGRHRRVRHVPDDVARCPQPDVRRCIGKQFQTGPIGFHRVQLRAVRVEHSDAIRKPRHQGPRDLRAFARRVSRNQQGRFRSVGCGPCFG